MKDHTRIFIDYFERGFWANRTGSSGPNSDPALTPILRENLQALLREFSIRSLVDAGCGDANLFQHMDIRGIEYLGLECVEGLVSHAQSRFQDFSHMRFQHQDVVFEPLPKADLILSRDVVHYLPNDLIQVFLNNVKRSGARYLLITHNTHSSLSANSPTELGIFRPVNLTQRPFCWPKPLLTIQEDVFAKELALFELASLEDSTVLNI